MSNRLPETDLANWAFLPPADKRRALEAFELPKLIRGSYEPFRKVFPDVVDQQFPLFKDDLSASEWAPIEARLRIECKGNQTLIDMNRSILHSTHKYIVENSARAFAIDVLPLRFSGIQSYFFGLGLLIRYRDHSSVVFLDMRRQHGLNPNGRAFVFSAMHQRYRIAYPDLADINMEIWRYQNNAERKLVRLTSDNAVYDYEQLAADIMETHQIWESVKRGDRDARRAASGGAGPLFD
jgi:hypothetical protein